MYDVSAQNCSVIIQVGDGTYDENVVLGSYQTNSTETNYPGCFILQGNTTEADRSNVKISPTTKSPNGGTVTIIDSSWTVQDLEIFTETAANEGFVIYNGCVATITNITFGDNVVGSASAVDCEEGSYAEIDNLTFKGTVANVFFAYGGSHIRYLGTTLTFDVDPGLSAGLFSAQGGSSVIFESAWAGTAASPANSTVSTGSTVVDIGNFLPASTYTVDSTSNYNGMAGANSKSGLPIATDLAPGTSGVFKDTSGGGVYLAYNDGGTLKKVALT